MTIVVNVKDREELEKIPGMRLFIPIDKTLYLYVIYGSIIYKTEEFVEEGINDETLFKLLDDGWIECDSIEDISSNNPEIL